ncbi:hypothetical protein [Spirilliplanes yamanashiensis]|uniref:Secreted protein n=1 Tax=Spirilliplanes yamanashiensis TaxID=42233 RepID=A0A8J3YDF9_9ACTN|nr:hypothetical protein [Spirilliplanes yamanashiensis]MDP9818294.1 hypothetical protein [Spirilliplanes yamanashiensis]GIJ06711.1 hypothetical protein Sya03_60630 [Spirilliplanes yamanashiensis]
MRTPIRLGAFALGLAAVFAASVGLGRLAGPTRAAPATDSHSGAAAHGAGSTPSGDPGATHLPGGLQVIQDGYRLTPVSGTLATGDPEPFRFQILGPDGAPVTRYTTTHDKDMHLIVVRRDLSGFQHVHPALDADGTWSIPFAVGAPGQYRVFADFQPAGHADGLTLGVDVPAPGDYQPQPLPAAARTVTVDGYTVTLDGDLTPGSSSTLTLSVSKDGAPVTDLQPYLGAYGHLVALRDGDLAYLHVHPDGTPGDGQTAAGPQVTFHAEVPSAGTYRLFLDFQHAGTVRTATFTAVAGTPVPAAEAPAPSPSGHGEPGHTHG